MTENGDVQKAEDAGREEQQRIPVLVQREAQTSPPLSPPAPATPDKVTEWCGVGGKRCWVGL